MLTIRLQRIGRRNDPTYRVVVTESKNAPQSGKFLEVVGLHDPVRQATNLKAERINYWLSVGAQTSDTVNNLLIKHGLKIGRKIKVAPAAKPQAAVEEPKSADETKTAGSTAAKETESTVESEAATDKDQAEATDNKPADEAEANTPEEPKSAAAKT